MINLSMTNAYLTLKNIFKYYKKQIDWNVVQVIVLVGIVPAMLIIGAIFFPLLTSYYSR
jgi:hypothetical protein